MMRGRAARLLPLVAAAAIGGCAVGPNYRTPQLSLPEHFAPTPVAQAGAVAPAPPIELATWWHALNDPELDSLIERAVRANPDVQIALERVQAARTLAYGSFSLVLPQGGVSAGGGRGTGSDLGRGRASQQLVSAENGAGLSQVNLLAGFDAAWQLDLFGKYRREIEAAHADAEAAAAARNVVLVAVIADVARAYVDLRGLQMRSAVLHSALDLLQQSLEIENERYQRGITNELDVTLATREYDSLRAQVARLDAQVSAAQYAIATLLGRYPQELVQELAPQQVLPLVPPAVAAGMPVDLLAPAPGRAGGRARAGRRDGTHRCGHR